MKSLLLLLLSFTVFLTASAQSDFLLDVESIGLPVDTFLNGSDGTTAFCLPANDEDPCSFEFPVYYNPDFGGYWAAGWAVSSVVDTTDGNFTNLYGSASGSGAMNSNTYLVGQQHAAMLLDVEESLINGATLRSFWVNNTYYAATVMRDGSQFSDPFGGADGSEADYFRLVVTAYSQGEPAGYSTTVYLADYRSEDPQEDYVLDDWLYVDLDEWGAYVDSVDFKLESSDEGPNGINTPLFFALDHITLDVFSSVEQQQPGWQPTVFPNPSSDGLFRIDWPQQLDWTADMRWYVHDAMGRVMQRGIEAVDVLDCRRWPAGTYYLIIADSKERMAVKLVKR